MSRPESVIAACSSTPFGQLGDDHQSVGRAGVHRGIVGAEPCHAAKSRSLEGCVELACRPAAHDELVLAGMLRGVADQRVRFGQHELVRVRIELGDAREGEPASIRLDALPEQRLSGLARLR